MSFKLEWIINYSKRYLTTLVYYWVYINLHSFSWFNLYIFFHFYESITFRFSLREVEKTSMILDWIYRSFFRAKKTKCSFSAAYIKALIHERFIGEKLLNNFHLNFLTFLVELFGSKRNIWALKRLVFISWKYVNFIVMKI